VFRIATYRGPGLKAKIYRKLLINAVSILAATGLGIPYVIVSHDYWWGVLAVLAIAYDARTIYHCVRVLRNPFFYLAAIRYELGGNT
jgi:hypothetical protein